MPTPMRTSPVPFTVRARPPLTSRETELRSFRREVIAATTTRATVREQLHALHIQQEEHEARFNTALERLTEMAGEQQLHEDGGCGHFSGEVQIAAMRIANAFQAGDPAGEREQQTARLCQALDGLINRARFSGRDWRADPEQVGRLVGGFRQLGISMQSIIERFGPPDQVTPSRLTQMRTISAEISNGNDPFYFDLSDDPNPRVLGPSLSTPPGKR